MTKSKVIFPFVGEFIQWQISALYCDKHIFLLLLVAFTFKMFKVLFKGSICLCFVFYISGGINVYMLFSSLFFCIKSMISDSAGLAYSTKSIVYVENQTKT